MDTCMKCPKCGKIVEFIIVSIEDGVDCFKVITLKCPDCNKIITKKLNS